VPDPSRADLSARATALLGIANLTAYLGEYRAAVGYMTENLAFCRATANDRGIITALHRLGMYFAHLGEHERAVQLCEESVALGRRVGDRVALSIALHTSGIVLYMVGRYEQSVAISDEAIGLLRELGNLTVIAYARRSQAGAIAESGDPARAIPLAEEGLRLSRQVGDKRGIGGSYKDLARFALLTGDVGRAAEFSRTSITICDELGDRWFIANCLYVLAGVKRAQGTSPTAGVQSRRDQLVESARLFGAADALREQSGVAVFPEIRRFDRDLALLREALGEAAFAQATREGRAMSMEHAIAFALATTAPPRPDATERSERATSATGPLSRREQEIAVLIADGLTNRQIAERLLRSERTVDSHLRNIMGKLEVGSRAQVAAWVVEHGLRVPR
jgi:non-specific serine/threonine protein kinase